MKTFLLLSAACLLGIAAHAQYTYKNLSLQSEVIASKYTWKNMRIYPILAKESFVAAHAHAGKYMTLAEALKQKKIQITESPDGEEVNKLFAQNKSQDTILILGGEVIAGGKQDRMIANDLLLAPGRGKTALEVFCVEHGRWTYNHSGAASYGFTTNYSVACTEVRKEGTVNKSQTDVWDKVQKVTAKNGAATSTGTYTALATDTGYKKNLTGYKTYFKSILRSNPSIIGMVVVTGDTILGCDLFASHPLLLEHADNIISSYATQAISSGSKVTIPYPKVKTYADNLLTNEVKQEEIIKEKGTQLKNKNTKLHIAVY